MGKRIPTNKIYGGVSVEQADGAKIDGDWSAADLCRCAMAVLKGSDAG